MRNLLLIVTTINIIQHAALAGPPNVLFILVDDSAPAIFPKY
jgi:hypothetical protein